MTLKTDYEDLEELKDRGDDLSEEEIDDDDDSDEELQTDSDESDEVEADDSDGETDSDEEEPDQDDIRIPKSRFDQVNNKYKESQERIAWLEEQFTKLLEKSDFKDELERKTTKLEEETSYDFDEKEEQYIELILEGDNKKAAQLRREIDSKRTELVTKQLEVAKKQVAQELKAAQEQEKFEVLVENYKDKYKILDENHKSFDEDTVETVNTLLAGFMAKGLSRLEALKKAVDKVVVPLVEKTPSKTTVDKTDKRLKEQRKANVKAFKQQPPKLSGKASKEMDVSKIDVSKMKDKDYSQLSKEDIRRLRGDFM